MKLKYFFLLLITITSINSCYVREVVINSKEHYDIKHPVVITKCDIPLYLGDNMYTIETERGTVIRIKDEMIHFKLASSKLEYKYLDVVETMKIFLNNNTNVILIVEGHSDSEGPESRVYQNAHLSRERVINVINAFSKTFSADNMLSFEKNMETSFNDYDESLIAYYFGDYLPYYTNTVYNKEKHSLNRRIEFVAIKCEKDYNKYNDSVSFIYNKTLEDYNIFLSKYSKMSSIN